MGGERASVVNWRDEEAVLQLMKLVDGVSRAAIHAIYVHARSYDFSWYRTAVSPD